MTAGVLNVLKPPGMSSHDAVQHVRQTLGTARVGHAGTLDPGAAGVLILLIGAATRVQQYIMRQPKCYVAEVTFGYETDTQDAFGEVVETDRRAGLLEADLLRNVMQRFAGVIQQIPPMASAVKYQGQPLYRLARQNRHVQRRTRDVEVYSIRLLRWKPGDQPRALLEIRCSSGTYIRTLVTDLARAMDTRGCLSFLVRTAVGSFVLGRSCLLEECAEEDIVPLGRALDWLPAVRLTRDSVLQTVNGRSPVLPAWPEVDGGAVPPGSDIRLLGPEGRLVAIGQLPSTRVSPLRVKLGKVFPHGDGETI